MAKNTLVGLVIGRRLRRGQKVGAVVVTCVLAVACDGPTRPGLPPAPNPAQPPPVTNQPSGLAGAYSLTIDIPESCAELPEAARRRTYDAKLDPSPYAYLSIRIVGEGYAVPTVTGDMWGAGVDRVSVDWNNFDIEGCDGRPESLPDGRTLMICGSGVGLVDGTTIAVSLAGQVFIETEGKRQLICSGTYPLTFRRAAAGATAQ